MSITLGIYDVFSYAIPGFIYLFVFNEVLKFAQLPNLDISKLDNLTHLFLLSLLSYLVGHLFDSISHHIWYRIFYREHTEERAYEKFKRIPGIKVDFDPHHWSLLLGVLRHNNLELVDNIDKNKATSIMLRNISFALFLLAVISVIGAFAKGFSLPSLLLAITSLISSIVTLRRSDSFNLWFYSIIYQQSLVYGDNLKEILEIHKLKTDNKHSRTATRKKSGK
jgi:hypothetical protein